MDTCSQCVLQCYEEHFSYLDSWSAEHVWEGPSWILLDKYFPLWITIKDFDKHCKPLQVFDF